MSDPELGKNKKAPPPPPLKKYPLEQGGGGGRLFNFSQFVVWHDHFFNTLFARKQQHKLFIDIKS